MPIMSNREETMRSFARTMIALSLSIALTSLRRAVDGLAKELHLTNVMATEDDPRGRLWPIAHNPRIESRSTGMSRV
jgi:hypothetical protein